MNSSKLKSVAEEGTRIMQNSLWIVVAVGVTLIIVNVLGVLRRNKVMASYENKHANLKLEAEEKISKLKTLSWTDYSASLFKVRKEVDSILYSLEGKKKLLNVQPPLSVSEITILISDRRLKDLLWYEADKKNLEEAIKKITSDFPDTNFAQSLKKNHYTSIDANFRDLCEEENVWKKALKLYQEVEDQIDEAKDQLDSASSMETLDLVTSNKTISFLSSLENSSASSELEDVETAVKELEYYLKNTKITHKMSDSKINVSDSLDLFSDLCLDLSFDFMSVFSLMQLSDAESSLEQLESQLAPLGSKINEHAVSSEVAVSSYLTKQV